MDCFCTQTWPFIGVRIRPHNSVLISKAWATLRYAVQEAMTWGRSTKVQNWSKNSKKQKLQAKNSSPKKKLAGLTKKKKMFRKMLRESRREDREARLYKCH